MATTKKSFQSPRKRSRYVDSYSKRSGYDWWNEYVFSLWQKSVIRRMSEYQEASCSRGWMHDWKWTPADGS